MRPMRFMCVSLAVVGILGGPGLNLASAQTEAQAVQQQIEQLRRDFDALKQQYGDRLTALEASLATIQGGQSGAAVPAPETAPSAAQGPSGAEGVGGSSGAVPVYGSAVTNSKVFNPDMAVIGDFLGAAGRNQVHADPTLEMHESEASFQAIVDPYARADFFISFGEEGVGLEEGFVTFTSLPGGLLTKVGKMRAAFGKVNSLHNHVLPWTDRPLVINNLVGGEDGIDDAGFSVARLIPVPKLFLEATGQVFRGDSGSAEHPLFQTSERTDLSYVGHLRAYQDITENSNVDLGASYSRGHNASGVVNTTDVGRFTTGLFGVDATYRWRPLQRSIYHSFIGRAEWIWSRRDQPFGPQKAMGLYASGDYQVGRRWFAGGRYDRSDHADNASLFDQGGSFILTYWPSEFSQVRGQYRRTNFAGALTADEFLFQFQFSIGAHGAHPF